MTAIGAASGPSAADTRAKTLTLRVAAVDERADGVVALTLEHPQRRRLPDWTPGAHIDVVLPNGVTRQYSLCGDRWDAHRYRIGVLREPDSAGGSHYIHDRLRPGDRIGVGGPRNNFPLVPAQRYLFIGGGIGITPLLPMVRQADLVGADWTLLYRGRHRAAMAFTDELAPYGERVRLHPGDEFGRPDLRSLLAEPRPGLRVYCCGPAGLLAAVEAACRHWPPHTLHMERFAAKKPRSPVRGEPFEVELRRSGRVVTVTPDISVLEAIRRAGVDVLSSCRQGVCGTCEAGVLDGRPDHRDSILAEHERSAADSMFVCVSRSHTDRLVLDL